MNIDINQIETYTPTIYVNNSEPDLDETNLNHTEQALKRVTDAANAAILALKSLDSAKIDAAKIVNNLLATDTSTVLSGPMGKALGERLTAAENLLTKLNGDILISSGSVAAVKGADTTICTLTLKAGHRYIILGGTSVSIAENASCMSASISVRNGVTSEWTGAGAAKTWMSNGGGCVTWAYAVCTTDVIVALDGYGYSDSTYTYGGRLLAIQLR